MDIFYYYYIFTQEYFLKLIFYTIVYKKKNNDIAFCLSNIEKFKKDLLIQKNSFDQLWEDLLKKENILNRLTLKRNSSETKKSYSQNLVNKMIDNILNELSFRFDSLNDLKFINLFDFKNFCKYCKEFPLDNFNSLKKNYSTMFDFNVLKTDLIIIYRIEELRNFASIADFLEYSIDTDLKQSLHEAFKLASLIASMPSTTASAERSFSCLRNIKSFLRNKMSQERLTNLSLINIEKTLLLNLKSKENFYDSVIDDYCKKERRIELKYKS